MADKPDLDKLTLQELGDVLLLSFVKELVRRVSEEPAALVAAEMNVIRQVLSDNSITIASVKRGDFGKVAQRVAENFPFDGETPVEYN